MNELLQIVLRQCYETWESSGYSFFWNILKDFILPILIAGFAGYMVYWVFVKETRRDISNEQARKDQERKDKLFYFSALVKSCTDIAIKQKEFIEGLVKEIDNDKINLKPLKKVVWDDLKRVSQNLNLENYLLAYVEYYKGDRKTSVKEFKAIVGSIDLFYEIFTELGNVIERILKVTYSEKLEIQNFQNNCFLLLDKFNIYLFVNEKDQYHELRKVMKPFEEKNSKEDAKHDFEHFYNDFFIPLFEFTHKYMARLTSNFSQIFELNHHARRGKELFETLESEALETKRITETDVAKIQEYIERIQTNSVRLFHDFN